MKELTNISTKRPCCSEWPIFMELSFGFLGYHYRFFNVLTVFYFELSPEFSIARSKEPAMRNHLSCRACNQGNSSVYQDMNFCHYFFLGQEVRDKKRHCHLFDFFFTFATIYKKYRME